MFLSERIIPVKRFPIKVYPYSIHEHEPLGQVIDFIFASNFEFPLLPNASRIDFSLRESQFKSEEWNGGSLISTWDQTVKLFLHYKKIRKHLWINVNDIEVEQIVPAHNTAPRMLRPLLWYTVNIGSFTCMEFKQTKFVKKLVQG